METLNPTGSFGPEFQLRLGTSADFPTLAAFLNQAHPDRNVTVEELERFESSRVESDTFEQVLVSRGGELVGLAEISTPRSDGHPGWLMLEIGTRPQDAGGPLAEQLLRLADANAQRAGAHTLITRIREHWWENEFLQAHGYREHDRMWFSVLDLTSLDFTRFSEQEAEARATGVQFRPLSKFGSFDKTLQRRLYTLIAELLLDVPSTRPMAVWPFEVWQQRVVPQIEHPEGLWLAVAPDGEWVGVSELHRPYAARPGMLHNGLTGVLKPWRGHHLGLALKLAAARAALERGFTYSRTGNHSINRPMLKINEEMGFQKETVNITLIRELSG